MAIAYVAGVTGAGANATTSGAIDTTGANLLVMVQSFYTGGSAPAASDSKSNTWTKLTEWGGAGTEACAIWYAKNATVGSGHTFTGGATGAFTAFSVFSFSGCDTTAPFDLENGSTTVTNTTVQSGAITPSANNYLVVAGTMNAGSVISSIDGGFSAIQKVDYAGGTNEGCGASYLIQTTATTANPTWTHSVSTHLIAVIASFKVSSGGTPAPRMLGLLGVGT